MFISGHSVNNLFFRRHIGCSFLQIGVCHLHRSLTRLVSASHDRFMITSMQATKTKGHISLIRLRVLSAYLSRTAKWQVLCPLKFPWKPVVTIRYRQPIATNAACYSSNFIHLYDQILLCSKKSDCILNLECL